MIRWLGLALWLLTSPALAQIGLPAGQAQLYPQTAAAATLISDTITTAPIAIYATVKTRSAYAGNCMTVKRLSDNTTQAVGFTGTNPPVCDSSISTGFCNGTTCVTGITGAPWNDQSGNGDDCTGGSAIKLLFSDVNGRIGLDLSQGSAGWCSGTIASRDMMNVSLSGVLAARSGTSGFLYEYDDGSGTTHDLLFNTNPLAGQFAATDSSADTIAVNVTNPSGYFVFGQTTSTGSGTAKVDTYENGSNASSTGTLVTTTSSAVLVLGASSAHGTLGLPKFAGIGLWPKLSTADLKTLCRAWGDATVGYNITVTGC